MPKYDLAVSFAGEQRCIAEYFARRLDASGYAVFYDEFAQAELWGSDLSQKLGRVYERQARHCLIIVSKEYVSKAWTNLERQNALARFMNDHSDYILCVRTDETRLPGLPAVIGYLDLNKLGEAEIYRLLLSKLGNPEDHSVASRLNEEDRGLAARIVHACYKRSVFTRMGSEIHIPAMLASLKGSMHLVQRLAPLISNHELQFNTLEIVSAIDSIERSLQGTPTAMSDRLSSSLIAELDEQKTRIVRLLLRIRRAASLAIQLPITLETNHFYSIEAANERPVEAGPELAAEITLVQGKTVHFDQENTASTIGLLCRTVHDEVLAARGKKNFEFEEMIMRGIRSDVFKGLRDDPLAKLHLGDRLKQGPDESLTIGPRGEEVRYVGVRTFPSGSIIGLFGVWPGRGHCVYAVVVDEKFPEFFGLYYRALEDSTAARVAWDGLVKFEQMRNEELRSAIVADGWTELVPQLAPYVAG